MHSYNRYGDSTKFVTDINELKVEEGSYVYISKEEDYDIAIDLGDRVTEFEKLKSYIVFVAEHVCELDNLAQKYMDIRHPNSGRFTDILSVIYIDEPDVITFEYWGDFVNTQYDVVFKYEDNRFKLKSFGMVKDISDNWDKQRVNELYEMVGRLKENGNIVNTYGGCEGDLDNPDGDVLSEFMEYIFTYHSPSDRPGWMTAFYQILCWQFQSCHEGVATYYENFYGESEYSAIVKTADYLQKNGYLEIYEQYSRGIVECKGYEYPKEMEEVAAKIDTWINWHTKEVWEFCVDILEKHKDEW